MRSVRLLVVAVLAVVLALPVGYAATGVVDQKQETAQYAYVLPAEEPAGQEFVPSLSPLIGVDVIVIPGALGAAFVTVNIRELTFDGNIISTVSQHVPPFPPGWTHFDLPSPVPVTVGSTYVLELTATLYVCTWWYGIADPYPSGRMIKRGGFVLDHDFTFRTYAPTEPVGGVVVPVNTVALVSPWLAVIGLVGCVATVVVVAKRRHI